MEDLQILREVKAPAGFLEDVLRKCELIDSYARVKSPVGTVYVAQSSEGISAVSPASDDATFERRYYQRFGRRVERSRDLREVAERAIAGDREMAIDLRKCNPFQRAVLEATRAIPRGTIRPYAWIAKEIGHPGAVRAVGTALAKNPVPLIVPCHRVVRSDGTTGEYALGADRKVAILETEDVDPREVERRLGSGPEFWVDEEDGVYCYPFCHPAKPLGFTLPVVKSIAEAAAHGLRPCSTCRPPIAA